MNVQLAARDAEDLEEGVGCHEEGCCMLRRTGISVRMNVLVGLFAIAVISLVYVGYAAMGAQLATQRNLTAMAAAAAWRPGTPRPCPHRNPTVASRTFQTTGVSVAYSPCS